MASQILTPAELAAYLRASERTVARMVVDGCPYLLVGRRKRFELEAVLAWTLAKANHPKQQLAASARAGAMNREADDYDASRPVRLRVTPSR